MPPQSSLAGWSPWESQKSSSWAMAGAVAATVAVAVTEVTEATGVMVATPVAAVVEVTAAAVMGPAAEAATTEATAAEAAAATTEADTELIRSWGAESPISAYNWSWPRLSHGGCRVATPADDHGYCREIKGFDGAVRAIFIPGSSGSRGDSWRQAINL